MLILYFVLTGFFWVRFDLFFLIICISVIDSDNCKYLLFVMLSQLYNFFVVQAIFSISK